MIRKEITKFFVFAMLSGFFLMAFLETRSALMQGWKTAHPQALEVCVAFVVLGVIFSPLLLIFRVRYREIDFWIRWRIFWRGWAGGPFYFPECSGERWALHAWAINGENGLGKHAEWTHAAAAEKEEKRRALDRCKAERIDGGDLTHPSEIATRRQRIACWENARAKKIAEAQREYDAATFQADTWFKRFYRLVALLHDMGILRFGDKGTGRKERKKLIEIFRNEHKPKNPETHAEATALCRETLPL